MAQTPRKPPLPSPPKKPDLNRYNHYHRAALGRTFCRHLAHRPDVRAAATPLDASLHRELLLSHAAESISLPTSQVIEIAVEATSAGCGYGVPVMQFVQERTRAERGRRYKER